MRSCTGLEQQRVGIDLSEVAARLVGVRIHAVVRLVYTIIRVNGVRQRTHVVLLPNYRSHKHTLFSKQEGMRAG